MYSLCSLEKFVIVECSIIIARLTALLRILSELVMTCIGVYMRMHLNHL